MATTAKFTMHSFTPSDDAPDRQWRLPSTPEEESESLVVVVRQPGPSRESGENNGDHS